MTDQLSLALDAERPRLPGGLRPMLHRGESAPFDSADHLFEPVWGGTRALALIEARTAGGPPAVRFLDRDGRPLRELPELAELPERVAARSAVLDGDLVAVGGDGRSDRAALHGRLGGEPAPALAYLVFDLIHLDGHALLAMPLERRRETLRRVLVPGGNVVALPSIGADGIALHAAVVDQGLAGVMARQRRSPYLPGVRSRLWRFIPASPPAPSEVERTADGMGVSPILALIQRLPLDDVD